MRDKRRRGSALIEALLALVLLATSGAAFVGVVAQTRHAIAVAQASEHQTGKAAEQLARLSVSSRAELVALMGRAPFRGWWLTVDRSSDALFDVSVAESDSGMILLQTTFYRPDSDARP